MPHTLHDYIYSDRPVLGLHITSFTNATIVTLSWPHVVGGGLGIKEIISAWSKALRTDGDLPALLGAREDVLDGIGTDIDNPPPYSLEPSQIKGWRFVKLALRLLWNVVRRPEVQSRTLCLPGHFVSRLKEAALRELDDAHQGDETIFISENDVMEAWASRFVAQVRGGQRSALVVTSLDIRSRVNALWDTGGVYVQNTAVCVYTSVDCEMLLSRPLGELSHVFRQSIQASATDEQIRAQLRIFRTLGHKKRIPLYGNPDSHLMSFSNWTKFDLFNAAEFSPAILSTSSTDSGAPVKPVYMHCQALGENRLLRDCFHITGKDLDGNYWITAFLYPEDWTRLEEYMVQTCQHLGRRKMSGDFSPAESPKATVHITTKYHK
ncbi:hypothetical protein ED733_004288 [Metarhizium rileyi]|uniref:Chloramphenicol acetyltransferase-like domain protein n=1 Tax=Metarhizium rileyi (strain RCEF 4871) TaxID=1649241 RepID=A0A5C6G5D4_METRR|nr:hypothetical protein ED733_004288 [Metarhizium rileyi]